MLVAASVGLRSRPEPRRRFPRSSGEREIRLLPVIGKVGGSVDRVYGQLDKVDRIMGSAVDGRRESDFLDELRDAGT